MIFPPFPFFTSYMSWFKHSKVTFRTLTKFCRHFLLLTLTSWSTSLVLSIVYLNHGWITFFSVNFQILYGNIFWCLSFIFVYRRIVMRQLLYNSFWSWKDTWKLPMDWMMLDARLLSLFIILLRSFMQINYTFDFLSVGIFFKGTSKAWRDNF